MILTLSEASYSDGFLEITHNLNWNGNSELMVLATDSLNAVDSLLISIQIEPVNDAPMITAIPDTFIYEDSVLVLDL